MKIKLLSRKNEGATLLLVCLGAAVLIGFPLTYYLTAVQSEGATVARSQGWTSSMVVTEAGIEEGMAFVNKYANSATPLANWATSASATSDGWTKNGNSFSLTRSNIFTTGTSYTVLITNVSSTNVNIKSTGIVPGPTIWSGQNISRAALMNTMSYGIGAGGFVAGGNVTLSGSATLDSFNSADPLFSTNGQYTAAKREAHANLLVTSGNLTMSGSSTVYGVVSTSPTNTITTAGNRIGDTNWASGIEPGWTNNTANLLIPNAPVAPSVTWTALPPVTVFGSTNQYILNGLGSTNYYTIPNSFNLSGSGQFIITNGNVFLNATGTFSMSGSSQMVVKTNSTVTAWLNGTTAISGGGVVNVGGNATNVTFYGTTNCTSIAYSGSSALIGVLNAPKANIAWSGSASFIGAFVVNQFNDSGGASLHFDEALLSSLNNAFVAFAWQEVKP
jgi:hypothetical protein